jgi:uncharacterized protein (DUF1330 family)
VPVEPSQDQFVEIASLSRGARDPVVMVNLNRYRANGGREAYARYAEVALRVLERIGGRVLWQAPALRTVIGDDSDLYDEVIAVWYPTLAAFVELATDPELLAARAHRVAGLDRAALICCGSGPEAVIETPGL